MTAPEQLNNSGSTGPLTVLETNLQVTQVEGAMSILCTSQNLITSASIKSLASSTAASAVSLLPESLLDLERPLDLDLVLDLDKDLGRLLLLLPEGDLERNLEPDEVVLLLLDLVSSKTTNCSSWVCFGFCLYDCLVSTTI